jgi:hypothetical protein
VTDPSITDAVFGQDFLGGKGAKAARRRIIEAGIAYQKDHGHWLIKLSDAEAWRESCMKTPEAPSLKSLLRQISEQVLEKRKGAEDEAAPGKESRGTEHRECSTP